MLVHFYGRLLMWRKVRDVMKVSIKEISTKTGFSPATVSNALNRKKGVNKDTSAEIFRVAKELGYINDAVISKIKVVIFKKNGSIMEDTPFFTLLLDGFERECRDSGYEMTLCYIDSRKENYESEFLSVFQEIGSAVVLLGTEMTTKDLKQIQNTSVPILLLDYWDDELDYNAVLINNYDAGRKATEYLINYGHKQIGYIRGDFRINAFGDRELGYYMAMKNNNLEVEDENIVTLKTTMDGAYRDMLKYLEKSPKLPTAFFADNDMIAIGAMKALQEHNIKIPEDISIIGIDDLPFCEITSPRITSLRVPKQEMGLIAAKRMFEIIEHKDDAILKIQICTTIIERESVKYLKHQDVK